MKIKTVPTVLANVMFVSLLVNTSAIAATPTNFEQYQLELINRARANPNAEVTRLSGSTWGDSGSPQTPNLNEGLAAGTISSAAKQPLTFNSALIQSARDYSNTLLVNNAFDHNFGGTTVGSRATAAGYTLSPPPAGIGENLSVRASSGALTITTASSAQLYDQLFIDGDVVGRGHRINILDPDWREIGIGLGQSTTYTGIGAGFPNAVLATQDFAFKSGAPFLTGVVYIDTVVDNNFYTPGEGLGGITLNAYRQGTSFLEASTTTYSSGGYGLALAPGAYDLQFINGAGQVYATSVNWSTASNFKLDAVDPNFAPIPEPSTWAMLIGGIALLVVVRARTRRVALISSRGADLLA